MTASKVCSTKVGVFATREAADRAIADLKKAGYRDDQIGLVGKDASGKTVKTGAAPDTRAGEGAAIGATAGAAAGAAVGIGVLAGVIPVIGPVLAIGTLGTVLLNAAGGAAIAGIAGALAGWGIPDEDAKYYEGEVNAGRFLVTVDTTGRTDDTHGVFTRHGGYNRATMQLKEEELRVSKTPVQKGEVEVRKEVVTEHKQVTVPVEREEVVVERRPAGGRASGEIRAEEIRIPVREEQVHVSKEVVAKEEVTVGKRKVQGTETVAGDVRKEELRVETEGEAKVRDTGRSDRK